MTISNHLKISLEEKYEREKALGMHPIYSTSPVRVVDLSNIDTNRRWLDNGEIIEFTSINQTTWDNAEFEINNDSNHKIWLSQLKGAYLNPENLDVCCWPDITLKNGQEVLLDYNIDYRKFWNVVKGKKFRIEIEPSFPVKIDNRNEQVRKLKNVPATINYIIGNLEKQNYEAVKGMTKKATLYSFIEV